MTSGMCTTAIPEVTLPENTFARLPVTRSWTRVRHRRRHPGSRRRPASQQSLRGHPSRDRPGARASRDWLKPHPPPGRTAKCLCPPISRRRGSVGSGDDGGASAGGSPMASASRFSRPCASGKEVVAIGVSRKVNAAGRKKPRLNGIRRRPVVLAGPAREVLNIRQSGPKRSQPK